MKCCLQKKEIPDLIHIDNFNLPKPHVKVTSQNSLTYLN